MSIRFKIFAATLGLVLASGAVGDAFAQSATAPSAKNAQVISPTGAVAPVKVKSPKTATALTHHRQHVARRGIAHKTAHRMTTHTKVAKRHAATTRLATSKPSIPQKHAMISKSSVIR